VLLVAAFLGYFCIYVTQVVFPSTLAFVLESEVTYLQTHTLPPYAKSSWHCSPEAADTLDNWQHEVLLLAHADMQDHQHSGALAAASFDLGASHTDDFFAGLGDWSTFLSPSQAPSFELVPPSATGV